MADILTDAEIDRLIAMPKQLPPGHEQLFRLKPKLGHKESELEVVAADGSRFVLMMREAEGNPLDFSAILAYVQPGVSRPVVLLRYNGKAHEHRNAIERETLRYDYHVHRRTERYQLRKGAKPDGYAVLDNRYAHLIGAMECLMKDCNFIVDAKDRHLFTDAPADDQQAEPEDEQATGDA